MLLKSKFEKYFSFEIPYIRADNSADPILKMTNVRESPLSAGFAGKSRNRGTLNSSPESQHH